MPRRVKIIARVRLNAYGLIARAVEEGIQFGINRAHKHLEEGQHPTDESLREHLHQEVLNALSEVLLYNEDET